ncbi:polysaccharide deacetylase [Hoeflea sp. CAU 1731]
MMRVPGIVLGGLLAASVPLQATPHSGDDPKQLVIISFDGAHDNALWDKSRAIAKKSGAHFTYFLSCTFLMTRDDGRSYHPPRQRAGKSNVGFASSHEDVRLRLGHIWKARKEGHEIASHGCGHFDGKDWSERDWNQEFAAFSQALRDAWARNGDGESEPEGWREFASEEIKGFRAPYLSTNGGLYSALNANGFAYDASGVSRGPVMPGRNGAVTTFDLPLIPEGPGNRRIIAMDYNLFVRHSGGFENAKNTEQFEARSYAAFRRAFDEQYNGERRPLQIGFHFVEMNGGAYWRAMERLATETCALPDVACVTYSTAMRMLQESAEDGGA